MQYSGQSSEGVEPVTQAEQHHPDLLYTERDRSVAYAALADQSIRIADYVRLVRQQNMLSSHQAGYFIGRLSEVGVTFTADN